MNDCSRYLNYLRGGMTSHAAVVARGMGTCCVSWVQKLIELMKKQKYLQLMEKHIHEGDYISLDGTTW